MASFETEDTEETVTCLHIKVYHPSQMEKNVFQAFHFCQPHHVKVDDLVKFGRDGQVCRFNFVDGRASRIQFALCHFTDILASLLKILVRSHQSVSLISWSVALTKHNAFACMV
uniref:Uncharacterized protein n=1 Tax=Podarcis muralis TaxID=64176 RepID=A0A670IRR8_PODMU